MPKVTFTGDPKAPGFDPEFVEMHGIIFPYGQPVEVEDAVANKLSNHSHFSTGAGNAPPRDSILKAEPVITAELEGTFDITRGSEVLVRGLNRAGADAFNALDDTAKANFVAKEQKAAKEEADRVLAAEKKAALANAEADKVAAGKTADKPADKPKAK
jgi:hypothetical protein